MQIAAQLFTLRDFLKTPADIDATFKKVKSIGYDAVQVSAIGEIAAVELKELADRHQLTICATHIPYQEFTDHLTDVIEKHRIWNCSYAGLGSIPEEYRSSREGYVTFAKTANEIAEKLNDAGIKFIYHNHDFEFMRFAGQSGMELLMEHAPNLEFELDVYWAQAGGADPAQWIKKLDGRMKVVHFKDMEISPQREQRFAEVGAGNMNWSAIIEACRSIGVKWAAIEQDNCYGKDPFDCLALSLNNLQNGLL